MCLGEAAAAEVEQRGGERLHFSAAEQIVFWA